METSNLKKVEVDESDDIDELISMMNNSNKSINELSKENSIDCYDYEKNDKMAKCSTNITGKALLLNKCDDIAVIDIDIKHDLNEVVKEQIRSDFIEKLKYQLEGTPIVKTSHGGLHIWVKYNDFIPEEFLKSGRHTKVYKTENYEVDLFFSVKPDTRSLIMLPGSLVKDDKRNKKTLTYEYINGDGDMKIASGLEPTLKALSDLIVFDKSQIYEFKKYNNSWAREFKIDPYEDLIKPDYQEIKQLISYFPPTWDELMNGIGSIMTHSSLDLEQVETILIEWYETGHHNNPIQNAEIFINNYYNQSDNNIWFYAIINKLPEEGKAYGEELKNKYSKNLYDGILKNDKFEYTPIKQIQQTKNLKDKSVLISNCVFNMLHLKCFFSLLDSETVEIIKYEDMDKILMACGIFKSKDRQDLKNLLMMKVRSEKEINFESLFVGFKYNHEIKSENYEKNVKNFKDCVLFNICDNEENIFEYLMKRISFILHNNGMNSNVCVILQGLQGTGKNWFEDIICELFSGYSSNNAELAKLTARFNGSSIIGKRYVVCNEALNADGMFQIKEGLKKLVERPTMEVERKGIDPITVKNSVNLDITTNNIKPVLIDPEDRRYLILRTNGTNANDRVYWKPYQEKVIKEKGFYNDVFTMIWNDYYDENFLSLPIPLTKATKSLMRLCATPIHRFIVKHLDIFDCGTTRKRLKELYNGLSKEDKGLYSENRFIEEVLNYCITKQKHNQTHYYLSVRLADRLTEIFGDDNDEDDDNDESQPPPVDDSKFEAWVNTHKQTTNKFEYILSVDVKDEATRDYLMANGWEYKTTLANNLRKRGYKLMKQ